MLGSLNWEEYINFKERDFKPRGFYYANKVWSDNNMG